MVSVPSTMLELGTPAPDFALPDTAGHTVRLADFKDARALLVMFICNHCPYVKHVQHELVRIARDYEPRGVRFVAISSNDVEHYPDDSTGTSGWCIAVSWTTAGPRTRSP
jgi:peroxiredoxin